MKLKSLIISISFPLISFSQSTIDNGLIAKYNFSGNAVDSSGNNNNGVVVGAILTSDRFGKSNSAYLFNGIDAYIQVPNSSSLKASSYELSISCWVKINNFSESPNYKGVILDKANNNFGDWGLYYSDTDGNPSIERLRFGGYVFKEGNVILQQGYHTTSIPSLGNWVHLVMTLNGNGDNRYFINGKLESTIGNGGNSWSFYSNSASLFIGKAYNNYGHFNGVIDDIRIYNRSLSATEACELYGCSVNGIMETSLENNAKIYPNPSFNIVTIDNVNDDIKSVKIIDQVGFVSSCKLIDSNKINLEDLNAGIYILEIELSNNRILRNKILKK